MLHQTALWIPNIFITSSFWLGTLWLGHPQTSSWAPPGPCQVSHSRVYLIINICIKSWALRVWAQLLNVIWMHTTLVKWALKPSSYILTWKVKRQDENNCHRFPWGYKLYLLSFAQNTQNTLFSKKRSEILKQMQLHDSIRNTYILWQFSVRAVTANFQRKEFM